MITLHFAVIKPEKTEFLKGKYSLTERDLHLIDACDPTPKKDFVDWLCGQYSQKNMRLPQDTGIILEALALFDSYKKKPKFKDSKDIYHYKKLGDLYKTLKSYEETGVADSTEQQKREMKCGAQVVYKDSIMTWYKIETPEQAAVMGSGTKWCTVPNKKVANQYLKENPIYICYLNKAGKPTIQLHLGKYLQIMNAEDVPLARGIRLMMADLVHSFRQPVGLLMKAENLSMLLPSDGTYYKQGESLDPTVEQWEGIYNLLPQNPLMISVFWECVQLGGIEELEDFLDSIPDTLLDGMPEMLLRKIEETNNTDEAVELLTFHGPHMEFDDAQYTRLYALIKSDDMASIRYYIRSESDEDDIPKESIKRLREAAAGIINEYTKKYESMAVHDWPYDDDFYCCCCFMDFGEAPDGLILNPEMASSAFRRMGQ
jgi:hypothetical protein